MPRVVECPKRSTYPKLCSGGPHEPLVLGWEVGGRWKALEWRGWPFRASHGRKELGGGLVAVGGSCLGDLGISWVACSRPSRTWHWAGLACQPDEPPRERRLELAEFGKPQHVDAGTVPASRTVHAAGLHACASVCLPSHGTAMARRPCLRRPCRAGSCPHAACAGHGKSCAPSFAAQPKWTRPKPHFSRSHFGLSRIWLKPFWLKSLGSTLNSSPRPLGATPPPHGTLADRRLEPAQLGRARRSPGSADPGPTAPHLPGGVGPCDHNLRRRRANLLPRGPGVPGVRREVGLALGSAGRAGRGCHHAFRAAAPAQGAASDAPFSSAQSRGARLGSRGRRTCRATSPRDTSGGPGRVPAEELLCRLLREALATEPPPPPPTAHTRPSIAPAAAQRLRRLRRRPRALTADQTNGRLSPTTARA